MLRLQLAPRVARGACALAATVAAGYLWAVVCGDGIHGLKSTAALDGAHSFPDANVVLIVAVIVYGLSPLWAAFWADLMLERAALARWFGATAIAGAALFVVSRLFI